MSNPPRDQATVSDLPAQENESQYLALGQVAEQVNVGLHQGQAPDVEALVARHPELATQIRQLVPALAALHQLGHNPAIRPDVPPEEALPRGALVSAVPAREAAVLGRMGDYQIIREIGRGGMGVVYEAEQVSLGRRVALKVLPFAAVLDPKRLRRFQNEAYAAAQLHHQNIVPVYSVGCERGVHFYAMQYIEGQSLAEVIVQLRERSGEAGRGDNPKRGQEAAVPADAEPGNLPQSPVPVPNDRPPPHGRPTADTEPQATSGLATERSPKSQVFFRSVATLGQRAAEALEHAHALGVVHRDIKPSNLLLDLHGKVWITDFGLARMEGEAGLTMTGDILGTIRYMSPEQALAKRVLLDHRTDIYSLGVTLYELLTLEPAFPGRDRHEILRRIAFEEPQAPRRLNSALPTDLETIVLKATAKNPAERYATAQAMADDLDRFLKDRPILAKRPTPLQRLSKWTRRHRALVTTAFVAFTVALVVGAAVAWSQWREAVHQRNVAQTNFQVAQTNYQVAQTNFQRTHALLKHFVIQVSDDPRLKAHGLQGLRRQLLVKAKHLYEELLAERPDATDMQAEQAEALVLLALINRELGDAPEAVRMHQRAHTIFAELSRTDPANPEHQRGVAQCQHNLGTLFSTLGRAGEAELALKQATAIFEKLGRDYPGNPQYQYDLANAHESLAGVYLATDRAAQAESAFQAALAIGLKLTQLHPNKVEYQQALAESHNNLGALYRATGRTKQAEEAFQDAVAVGEQAFDPERVSGRHLSLAKIHRNLGDLYFASTRPKQAEPEYHKALAVGASLSRLHPDVPEFEVEYATCLNSVAILFRQIGRFNEAQANGRKALEIWQRLAKQYPEDAKYPDRLGASQITLGNLCKDMGQMQEAETAYQEALALRQKLIHDHPLVPDYQSSLAKTHHNLGELFQVASRPKEAEANYRKALELWEKLIGSHAQEPEYRYGRGRTHLGLGQLYAATRRPADAEAAFQSALDALDKLVQQHPGLVTYEDTLADTLVHVGVQHRAAGRKDEAEAAYRKALAIHARLAQQHPDSLSFAIACAGTCCNLGNLLQTRNQPEESLAWYDKAVQALEAVLKKEPRHLQAREFMRKSLLARAWGYKNLGRHEQALPDWDAALPFVTGPFRLEVRSQRALTLAHLGQHHKAAEEARELGNEKGSGGAMLYNLACVLALSSTAASADQVLPALERHQLAEQYAARAVALLGQAQAAGFFKAPAQVEHLKKDPDLNSLRSREDFRNLLRSLQSD